MLDGCDAERVNGHKVIECLCYDQLQVAGHYCSLQLWIAGVENDSMYIHTVGDADILCSL